MHPDVKKYWSKLSSTTPDALQLEMIDDGVADKRDRSFFVADHVFTFDFDNRIQRVLDLFVRVAPLELSIAPVVVDTHLNDVDMVMLTRYPACTGEDVVPVEGHPGPFTNEIRARFRADIERLYGAGFAHPWSTRGLDYWYCGARSRTLVLGGWRALAEAERGDLAEDVEDIDLLLSRLPG